MVYDLPVDLLEDIFLRLDDAADLARASAACTSFNRVVSDGRFLRRFRSLHRRQVLGLLLDHRYEETSLFYAAQPPRRSAQAAAGFAKAADFSLAFLPDPGRIPWKVCDVLDGRVLLYRCPDFGSMFEELVVYDPLRRRHVQIPTIPDDLVPASNDDDDDDDDDDDAITFDSPFLMPAVDDDDDELLLRFQVTCIMALSKTEVVAFVFSSASGQWRREDSFRNPSYDWADQLYSCRQHVHDRVCWVHILTDVMLVFDTREMKLSMAVLPQESFGLMTPKMAVEAGDGRVGLLLFSEGRTEMHLYSKAWREPQEWQRVSSIPTIPGFYLRMLAGAAEGYVLLRGVLQDQFMQWLVTRKKLEDAHYFTLDLKTLRVEKLCVLDYDPNQTSFLYASFPPMFSSPIVV